MLASQLAHLPLLPFLEHHPHPTYVLPDGWFAPAEDEPSTSSSKAANDPPSSAALRPGNSASTSRASAAIAPVWLNEAAKAVALSPIAWADVRSVVRRSQVLAAAANGNGGQEQVAKRPPLLHLPVQGVRQQQTSSTAVSEVSSDGGTSTARPGSSTDGSEPSAPTVLGGRFTTAIIDVPATNYRVLQLVPCSSTPSPVLAWTMASSSGRREPSSPSHSEASPLDLLAQATSTLSVSYSIGTSSASLSSKSEIPPPALSSDTASPTSELPPRPIQDGPRPSAPSAVILSDRAPAKPTADEEYRRRCDEFRMAEMTANFDWSKTALGPREDWPQSLKTIVSVVLNTHSESCLWWGPGK